LRRIGAGGLGVVYEARHQQLDKPVAVKALHGGLAADPHLRERFLREGRTAAKLRHPNVVDVYDVAIERDTPYLVMELLKGEDLSALIARKSPLGVEPTLDLLLPIVSALASAHELGILHRDLKPQNVFLSEGANGSVTPKVVDFGVSKILDEHATEITHSNTFVGTPHYMSPEQARAEKHIDHRCDQFSLGVIAYECLTGSRPFTGNSLLSLLEAIVHHNPPTILSIAPKVNPEVARIVAQMMAKLPSERHPNMRAVGAALLPFAGQRARLVHEQDFPPPTTPVMDSSISLSAPVAQSTLRHAPWPWELDRIRGSSTSRFQLQYVAGAFAICGLIVLVWMFIGRPRTPAPIPRPAENVRSTADSSDNTPSPYPSFSPVSTMGTPATNPTSTVPRSDTKEREKPATPSSKAKPKPLPVVPRIQTSSFVEEPVASNRPEREPAKRSPPERGVNGALILP
jgi:serine/threonine-protein kinase